MKNAIIPPVTQTLCQICTAIHWFIPIKPTMARISAYQ